MENLASVVDRIRTIESRVQQALPATGFDQVLARAGDAPAQTPQAAAGAGTFSPAGSGAGRTALSLSQMLGRPLPTAPGATPISAAGATGIAGPATGTTPLRLPVDARVSSVFGPRVHPVTGKSRLHAGIDLAAPTGTPIGAAAGGTVSFAGVRGGYGNLVIVDHGDGTETRYAHQDTIAVRAGQPVAAGDLLGTVGSTGQSTGPHLHFEFRRDGQPVDPAPLLGVS